MILCPCAVVPCPLPYALDSPLPPSGVDVIENRSDGLITGKAKVINLAIQDIGMGRYQWELFILCGFGWLADK